MAPSCQIVAILLVGAALTAAVQANVIAPRLIGGVPVDTLRRFPHHVTIEPIRNNYEGHRFCAGSILNEQWILTSALCVDGSQRLQLHFEKLYYLSTEGSYTAVVNSDAIHIYPTYYDDIALVKIPMRLVFSDTIKPVNLAWYSNSLDGRLAVMPGFDIRDQPPSTTTWYPPTTSDWSTTDYYPDIPARSLVKGAPDQSQQLTYGMFNILSNARCASSNKEFDEYLQLCTETWGNNANNPCSSDYGSGLLVGWPAKSELVGIYSVALNSCNSSSPAIYTNVAKYVPWIESVIKY